MEFPVAALVMFDRGYLVPFCLPKKEPKRPQGASFDEHLACAGVHRRRPLDPRLRGDAILRIWHLRPAAPNTRPYALLAPGLRPY